MSFPSLLATADRAVLGILGGAIRYVSATGATADVGGVFSNASDNAIVQGQEVISSGPRVFLLLADLPTDPEAEIQGYPLVVVSGVTYAARDVRKDGEGGVLLLLNEVDA